MRDLIKSIVLFGIGVFILSLFSCEEDEIVPVEPICSCFERHETLQTVNNGGLPTLAWLISYETTPVNMPCTSETEYTSINNSQRYKVICQ